MHRAPYPPLVPGARLGRRPFPAAARPAKRFRPRRRVPAAHDALGARPNATGLQSTTAAVPSPPAEFTSLASCLQSRDQTSGWPLEGATLRTLREMGIRAGGNGVG